MQIAILTLDGFNELDSFIAAGILNRMKSQGWAAHITCPTPEVTSMAGVTIQRQKPLDFLAEADAVLIGSGIKTRDYAADPAFLSELQLDPSRQLIGAQCSGTLLLAKLGLTPQKPLQRAYQRDPEAIEKWQRETFPAIAAQAKAVGAEIFFWDESGFRADTVRETKSF